MSTFLRRRFSENLYRHRMDLGISQEELGTRASLHRNVVGELERGARMPALDTVLKLAAGLDLPPSSLIEGIAWCGSEFGPPVAGSST